jgi:hypothetical protein
VLPTGCGKTVVFAHIIKQFGSRGRALVVAHREELIDQAAAKIQAVTGEVPDIEMADRHADVHMFRRAGVVVASVQTLLSDKRLHKFRPEDFTLIVTDEAHHATASSYRRIYDYFAQNPKCQHVGVTATPDRADEEALGQIYDSVAPPLPGRRVPRAAATRRLRHPRSPQSEVLLLVTRLVLKTQRRQPKHAPNKTEQRYWDRLELDFRAGRIKGFGFQRYTFRLADDTRYTPDFHVVRLDDVLEFHEVKGGFEREDAILKLKIAAEMYPHPFKLARWTKEKGWEISDI